MDKDRRSFAIQHLIVIDVISVNDPPVAMCDSIFNWEDSTVVIDPLVNDYDIEGPLDSTSVTILTGPSHGTAAVDPITGAITYHPVANYFGGDTMYYEVCDLGMPVLCDTACIIIWNEPVNDPPVIMNGEHPLDTICFGMWEDDTMTWCPNVVHPDPGDTLIWSVLQHPVFGVSFISTDTCLTYIPDPNYYGNDTTVIMVCDSSGWCDTVLVCHIVMPVNDPPIANDECFVIDEDVPITVDPLINDSDLEGPLDTSSVTIISGPNHGTAVVDTSTGMITYTPALNYFGQDTLFYVVCDLGVPLPAACDTAYICFDILPVNDPPTAIDDSTVLCGNDTIVFDILGNDWDLEGDSINVSVLGTPSYGLATYDPQSGNVTYIPNTGYSGYDQFSYVLCDQGSPVECDTASITVYVRPLAILNFTSVPALCFDSTDGSIDLQVTGVSPFTYVWSNGVTTQDLSGIGAGVYTVTVTDSLGCDVIGGTIVGSPGGPLTAVSDIRNESCLRDKDAYIDVQVSGGTPGYSYLWSTGHTGNMISNITQGPYTLTVTDANGCQLVVRDTILGPGSQIGVDTLVSHVVCKSKTSGSIELTVTGGQPPYTFLWSTGAVTQNLYGLTIGTYTVSITDFTGCWTTRVIEVRTTCPPLFVPEGFSPNGDGDNDTFEIIGLEAFPGNTLKIFNRWGNLIFEMRDYDDSFDGVANRGSVVIGEGVPEGTYFYVLDLNNGDKPLNGYIILKR